jgi:hypothetical protein
MVVSLPYSIVYAIHRRQDMRNRDFIYQVIYTVGGLLVFFFGMTDFQHLSWELDPYTIEHKNLPYWLPVLATGFLSVGWISGRLTTLTRTPKARVVLAIATIISWLLLFVVVSISFGGSEAVTSRVSGIDIAFGGVYFAFSGYFLSMPKRVETTALGGKESHLQKSK